MRKQIEEFTKDFIIKNGLEGETYFSLEIIYDGKDNVLDYHFNCNGEMPQVVSDVREKSMIRDKNNEKCVYDSMEDYKKARRLKELGITIKKVGE